ncbi:hypothetical protein WN943_020778 [Citrus x changshan-huyou]
MVWCGLFRFGCVRFSPGARFVTLLLEEEQAAAMQIKFKPTPPSVLSKSEDIEKKNICRWTVEEPHKNMWPMRVPVSIVFQMHKES